MHIILYVHLFGHATGYLKGGRKRRRRRKRRTRVSGSSEVAHTNRADSSASSSQTGVTSAGGGTPAQLSTHADSAPGPSIIGGSTAVPPANLIDLHTDTPSVPGESINGLMATLNLN